MRLNLVREAVTGALFVAFASAYLVDPPTTASSDTIQDCSSWQVVVAGNTCASIADSWFITTLQFAAYNPSVGSECKLTVGNSYCIEQNWGIPPEEPSTTSSISSVTPTPTPTKPANGVATPSPIQSGMAENCNNFYYVIQDDSCYDIAAKYSISLDQFYAWNPYIQDTCARLWTKTYVCVGLIGFTPTPTPTPTPKPSATPSKTLSSSTKTTPTNGIATPSPIQSGMVTNCNKFYLVQGGDGCWDISTKNGITPEQFSLWNPAVGTDCAKLYPNNYVCVSIVGLTPTTSSTLKTTAKPTSSTSLAIPPPCTFNLSKGEYVCPSATPTTATPTSTKPGNGIVTPTPIQTGMTTNCKKFYKVKSGDGCWAIADANKIALADFYKWNPAVGSNCGTLWPDNYVCIGV